MLRTSTGPSAKTARLAPRSVGNPLPGSLARMGLRECSKTATVNGKWFCNARAIDELEQLMGGRFRLLGLGALRGQSRPKSDVRVASALLLIATKQRTSHEVGSGPGATFCAAEKSGRFNGGKYDAGG